jgi:exosortase
LLHFQIVVAITKVGTKRFPEQSNETEMTTIAQLETKPTSSAIREFARGTAVTVGLLASSFVWAYWPILSDMADRWQTDPQYSHGYLVPIFSLYLLWSRRSMLPTGSGTGRWLGLGWIGLGLLMRAAGVLLFFGWLEAVSILPCLAGCVIAITGRGGLRWAYPGILFLIFMIPLPYALQSAMSQSLQRAATDASTYLLVTLGVPAISEGNVILLGEDVRLAVVAACSGLGMVMTFLTLSAGMAIMLKGEPIWARTIVVMSTVPVAIAVNTLRITATGILHHWSESEWARWVFHDVAGWLMMPIGLILFFALLWATRRAVVTVRPVKLPVLLTPARAAPSAA